MQKSIVGRVGDYTIRFCTADDIPSVININALTLPEHYSDYFYYEILSEFPHTFLVSELGDKIVGYIMCRSEYGLSLMRRFGLARKGHIISIATLAEHRGKGIATKLIECAVEEMKKVSSKELFLEVRVSNGDAIRLYNKLGMQVNSTLQSYYKDGESAYIMAMQL